MTLQDSFAEVLDVQMGINLGGSEVFVSEQLLYDAQVRTVLQEMRGE